MPPAAAAKERQVQAQARVLLLHSRSVTRCKRTHGRCCCALSPSKAKLISAAQPELLLPALLCAGAAACRHRHATSGSCKLIREHAGAHCAPHCAALRCSAACATCCAPVLQLAAFHTVSCQHVALGISVALPSCCSTHYCWQLWQSTVSNLSSCLRE